MARKKPEAVSQKTLQKKLKGKKVFIATPMYGGMCTGSYTMSLLMMQTVLTYFGVESSFCNIQNESLVPRARNALVASFLKTDFTHLLFIDADISFNPSDIMHMMAADKDIICGVYPKKEINWHTVKTAVEAGVPAEQLHLHTGSWVVNLVDYQGTVTVPSDVPLEVWASGTGMMLIKRSVFEELKGKVPSYLNDVGDTSGGIQPAEEIHEFFSTSIEPVTRRLLSEDYHFCRTWRLHGGKIYIAPWVNLGHVGTYQFTGQFLKTD